MSEYPIAGGDNYANAEAQDEFEREQNRKYEQWKAQEETIESQAKPESTGEATPTDSTPAPEAERKKEDKGLIHGLGHGAAAIPLGTADFVSDAIGIVPWLKPVDDWWDENSPRSNHPVHKREF